MRAGKLGVKFRRQAAIGSYVVDFVCFSHQLIVELDGPQHVTEKGKDRDARRTAWLESPGFRVIRFRNQMLDDEIQFGCRGDRARFKENKPLGKTDPLPNPPHKGEGTKRGFYNENLFANSISPALPMNLMKDIAQFLGRGVFQAFAAFGELLVDFDRRFLHHFVRLL